MRSASLGFLVLLVAATLPETSTAMIVNFTVDGGPLGPYAGVTASGVFSFDDGIIPEGGGKLWDRGEFLGVLSSLSFNWGGTLFDESNSDLFLLDFGPDGTLLDWGLGAIRGGNSVSVISGPDFYINTTFPRQWADAFAYTTPEGIFSGSVPSHEPIPEPHAALLFGVALGCAIGISRRFPD